MADLIDRIELMRRFEPFGREIPKDHVIEVIARQEAVGTLPTIDRPRPIDPTYVFDPESGLVPISACEPKGPKTIIYADRPKGKWNVLGEWVSRSGCYGVAYCSECNYELHGNNTNFCPNCGADMRGEDE